MVKTKIVLIMEYDGKNYHGFQLQAGIPTIQGETEKALWKLTRERSRVMAASRTDAGVHAKGQVVSFNTGAKLSSQTFRSGLNYYLPRDIAVKAAYRLETSFNVRHALSREYNYYILNSLIRSPLQQGYSYLVTGYLNIEAMNEACQSLIGERDFTSFVTGTTTGIKSTIRKLYKAKVERYEELAIFNIVASSFLPHQVRNTIGALIRVGQGKMKVNEFSSIIEEQKPGLAGPTAPACGLCLMQINYSSPFREN
ncbi:tRNA pseudouridine(38-40) synthase TruA [Chloroflexota bacterium]